MLASWIAPDWIVHPMTAVLDVCVKFTHSYGLGIILLTIALRLVTLPLTIYQTKSMKRMQEVQPLIKELQTKYKDDPQKLNAEMMGLYKTQGVNPFAGCLPMLIQMPFLYAIYAVLRNYAPPDSIGVGFLWIHNLNLYPGHDIVLAALTVISMFLQTYLSGAGQDQNQKAMLYIMPVMFAWMAWSMQPAIDVYWVVSTFFGIAQQAIYPGFPRLKPAGQGAQGGANAR